MMMMTTTTLMMIKAMMMMMMMTTMMMIAMTISIIFLKLVARGFLPVLRFPPLFHRFNGSANKIKLK